MRIDWKHVAIGLAVLPVVALFVAWIGFFNVGASSGHWKITEWFLHFAMRSAVRTYALAVEVPDELPREAIQPAAGHFARGCAICHGAPGEPRSPAALAMLPQPPDLAQAVGEWNDAELFRLAKHGIRFTGMPAWPTQARNDEVWAMVAFLRELPAMDAGTYRELAYGGASIPPLHAAGFEEALAECSRCHGLDGLGRSPFTPVLAGQNEAYLLESLRAYAENSRASGMMQLAARAVDPEHLPALARHYAESPPSEPAEAGEDAALVRRGEEIARSGLPAQKVPACLGCHGAPERNPVYPRIAGQSKNYIARQLRLFREDKRGGTAYSHLMAKAAHALEDEDIAALAAYFSTLRPEPATPAQ